LRLDHGVIRKFFSPTASISRSSSICTRFTTGRSYSTDLDGLPNYFGDDDKPTPAAKSLTPPRTDKQRIADAQREVKDKQIADMTVLLNQYADAGDYDHVDCIVRVFKKYGWRIPPYKKPPELPVEAAISPARVDFAGNAAGTSQGQCNMGFSGSGRPRNMMRITLRWRLFTIVGIRFMASHCECCGG